MTTITLSNNKIPYCYKMTTLVHCDEALDATEEAIKCLCAGEDLVYLEVLRDERFEELGRCITFNWTVDSNYCDFEVINHRKKTITFYPWYSDMVNDLNVPIEVIMDHIQNAKKGKRLDTALGKVEIKMLKNT